MVTRDKETYSKREETKLRIKLTDNKGLPLKGYFSLSAIDTKQLPPDLITDNIQSSFLLTSDVNEWVNNPAQYFGENRHLNRARLDLLMMTKGWRRFNWADLIADNFPKTIYPVEQGFSVKGRVTQGNRGKKGVANGKIKQIGMFNGVPTFAEAKTDAKGNFEMSGLYYYKDDGLIRATGKGKCFNLTGSPSDISGQKQNRYSGPLKGMESGYLE